MLQAKDMSEIPEETDRVARATFPKGNRYMILRDELGVIYADVKFQELFIWRGRPAESPGLLAMVTVMQFAEGLTDRQAAEAVQSRIDWKYALGLPLTYTGFAHSVLSQFRRRLLEGSQEELLLDAMLKRLQEAGWVKGRGRQRTDSTHVLAAIRDLNRLECVGETMRKVLNDLASVAPDWIVTQVDDDWFGLYGPRFEAYRLPQERAEREALQLRIGHDGLHLLMAIYDDEEAPAWLWELPSVQILRQVWIQQFYLEEDTLYIRTTKKYHLPPGKCLIQSPYDPEARYRTKRQTKWTGYAAHLTESCDEALPNLITHVATTPATTGDEGMVCQIHRDLAAKTLLPTEHLVDTTYHDAQTIVATQPDGVELIAPVKGNNSWQARDEAAYDLSCFFIDWDAQLVTCPNGKQSVSWRPHHTPFNTEMIAVAFHRNDCTPCPQRQRCTQAKARPRGLTFRPKEQYLALEAARQYQKTDEFKQRYRARAGIEGAISQAVRSFGLRRSRYVGLAKTHLQHVVTGAAMNLTRLAAWLDGVPKACTRFSRFATLAPSN
jgi:transposase